MFDWNDLRYFVAVADGGSTLAASRALKVDQSTVQRRVAELERRLGQPLVKRTPGGYRLTEFGQTMLAAAEGVAQAVRQFEQQVAAYRDTLAGVVRITCPEPIVPRLRQSSLLQRFHDRYPGLQLDFVISDRYVDLANGDADLALRSGDTTDGELIGRKLADSLWAVYGSQTFIQAHGSPQSVTDLARYDLIGLDGAMAGHRYAQWLRDALPQARIVARNSSVLGLVQSVRAGLGLAALPVAAAGNHADLVMVLGPVNELTRIWRVLTTRELRHAPRVAALFDFLVEEIDALRPILSG
jgi:DNA-binding transcriptional LysR family regulator